MGPCNVIKNASVQQPLSIEPLPFPLSSRAYRISCFTALTSATFVVLPKENHMPLTEATTLDRKSGVAEGSAVSLARSEGLGEQLCLLVLRRIQKHRIRQAENNRRLSRQIGRPIRP